MSTDKLTHTPEMKFIHVSPSSDPVCATVMLKATCSTCT